MSSKKQRRVTGLVPHVPKGGFMKGLLEDLSSLTEEDVHAENKKRQTHKTMCM